MQNSESSGEKGLKVKVWWFKARAKAILSTTHPNNTFKYSEGWFTRFKKRYKISLRRPTNKAQKHPETKEDDIQKFHKTIRKVQISSEGDGRSFNFARLLIWTRHLSHLVLQVAPRMTPPMFPQFGSEVLGQDLISANVLHS